CFRGHTDAHPPHNPLYEGDRPPSNAERPHAKSDQCECHQRLRCHLAANGYLQTMRNADIDDSLYQSQHRRVKWGEPRSEVGAAAVDGEGCLHEVVAATAEDCHI